MYEEDAIHRVARARALAEEAATAREQRKYFEDPTNTEKLIAHTMRQAVPEKKLAKLPYASDLSKIEAAIPEGDPRKTIGSEVMSEITAGIPRLGPDVHPATYISNVLRKKFGDRTEDIYKYIQKEESSLPFFKTPVAPAPGYEEWKKGFLEQTAPPEGSLAAGFAKGAGVGAAMELAGRAVFARGGPKLLSGALMASPATAPIGLALGVASTAMGAADVLTSLVQQTEWARQRPWKSMGVELLGALGIYQAAGKAAARWTAGKAGLDKAVADVAVDGSAANLLKAADAGGEAWVAEDFAKKLADKVAGIELQNKNIGGAFKELGAQYGLESGDAASLYVRDRQKQGVNLSRTLLNRIGVLQKVEDTGRVKALVQEGMSLEDAAIKVTSEETALKTYYPEIAKSLGLVEGIPEVSKYAMARSISPAATLKQMRTTIEGIAERNQMPVFRNVEFTAPSEATNVEGFFSKTPGLSLRDLGIEGKITEEGLQTGVGLSKIPTQTQKTIISLQKDLLRGEEKEKRSRALEGIAQALTSTDEKVRIAAGRRFAQIADNLSDTDSAALSRRLGEIHAERNPAKWVDPLETIFWDKSKAVAEDIGNDITKIGKAPTADITGRRTKIIGATGLIISAIAGGLGVDIDKDGQLSFVGTAEAAPNPALRIVGAVQAAKKLTGKELYQGQKEAGLIARAATAKDFEITEDMVQRAAIVDTTKVVPAYTKKLPLFGDAALSPSILGLVRYGIKEGKETFTDPIRELASHQAATVTNTANSTTVFNNIMNEYGIRENWKAVAEATEPFIERYYTSLYSAGYAKDRIGFFSRLIKKNERAITKNMNKQEEEAMTGLLSENYTKLKGFKVILAKHAPEMESLKKELDPVYQDLAQRFPGSRVFFAANDTANFERYPWLRDALSKEELITSARNKKLNEHFTERVIDAREEPILAGPYVHYAMHPKADFKKIEESFMKSINAYFGENVITDGAAALRLSKLHSRSVGALPMMPDMHFTMQRYLPDINRRLEIMEFWNGAGKKNATGELLPNTGWAAHAASETVQGNDVLRKFWDGISRSFDPQERTTANKWANRLYDFEISRLLSLSPSVGFKHILKPEANWSIFPALDTIKTLPTTVYRWSKSGFTKTGLKEDLQDEAMRSFTSQNRMMQLISDQDVTQIPEAVWDRFTQSFNQKGGMIINAVERLDRGHSVVAAMHMAAKKGMTPAQAAYGVMDTILKTNFLSGNLNPKWLRDPKVRMLFMFQGTPFKIAEQRALMAIRAGGNVTDAVKETWRQLNNLRSDVKDAEHTFKGHLIFDALTKDRDIFGTAITQQFMRKMLIIGTSVAVGKQFFDADLLSHFVHFPLVKFQEGEVGLALNPALTAAYQSWNAKETEDKDLWISEFIKQWLREGPVQQNFIKAARISRDDIPARYKDSRLKYLFGIPALKED